MKTQIFAAFLIIIGNVTLYSQPYPEIRQGRPRIYIDSSRWEWLRANKTTEGDYKTSYETFEYRYNNWWINDPELYLEGDDSTLWTWNWGSQYARNEAMFAIFMCQLNRDSLAMKRCRFLTQKAIDTINAVDYSTMAYYDEENFHRMFSDMASLMLDWCYYDLSDTLRRSLARAHYALNREFMNKFILSSAGNSYVSSHNAWNCVYANQNMLALYGADGLTAEENDTVLNWYKIVYDKWINGFLPCYGYYRDDDGGWNWGAAYAMWSLMDQFQMFDNMLAGTGKNFYYDLPWVQNSINQYWYFIQPDTYSIHLGDGIAKFAADRVTYRHAQFFNDPRSIWLAQEYSKPEYYSSTPVIFMKLLYKDFTRPEIEKPSLPLDWWSDKVGLSVSRTSWDSSSVMTTFFCSPSKRAAHEHRDNNSFTVFKDKPLLIDAGYYDTYAGTHYRNYYQRTIAHNSICVYDSTETYTNFNQAASNDGGQIESQALQNYNDIFLPQNQRGVWLKYAAGSDYQYNIADAQLSYSPEKLDLYRRRFLFCKPNKIIVLDHLHLNKTETHQRKAQWLAHFVNRPEINGNAINTEVDDHIITYDGRDYFSKYGDGSIAIRTLLPENSETRLVGGWGYEYWVDGENYPPISPPDTINGAPGRWRIEVSPTAQTDSLIYLHTIRIGDSTLIAVCGGEVHQSPYSIGVDWDNTLYCFSKNGDTNVYHHYLNDIAGNRAVKIFALDIASGNYYILVDGETYAYVETDTAGIIHTQVELSEGNHSMEIVQTPSIVKDSLSPYFIRIYPNPTYTELLFYSNSNLETTIAIYNYHGEEVISCSETSKIDISCLENGVYFVVTNQGMYRHVEKLVICR
jgi:hypothetical protein